MHAYANEALTAPVLIQGTRVGTILPTSQEPIPTDMFSYSLNVRHRDGFTPWYHAALTDDRDLPLAVGIPTNYQVHGANSSSSLSSPALQCDGRRHQPHLGRRARGAAPPPRSRSSGSSTLQQPSFPNSKLPCNRTLTRTPPSRARVRWHQVAIRW